MCETQMALCSVPLLLKINPPGSLSHSCSEEARSAGTGRPTVDRTRYCTAHTPLTDRDVPV